MTGKTYGQRLDAEVRQIRSMRQFRDALADGELTEDEIVTMALARLGRERPANTGNDTDAGLRLCGQTWRGEGEPLLGDQVVSDSETMPEAVHSEDLPWRTYDLYVDRRDGRPRLVIDLNFETEESLGR